MMNLKEICKKYRQVYTPAVSDVLDKKGCWNQTMEHSIHPLKTGMKVAGPAFTMLGMGSREVDKTKRLVAPEALDHIKKYVVVVMATSGDENAGHWGELMTNAALFHGCAGAVVDGGIRDTWNLFKLDFPIFYKFKSPCDALGRFNIIEYQTDIVIGGVKVRPGDFIVGDDDGIVVVPEYLILEVLEESEETIKTENEIRKRVIKGESVAELYVQYDQF